MKITKRAIEEHSSLEEERRHIRILSIHFGPNWVMKHETEEESAARRDYCHRIIDERCRVDLVYGHPSRHSRRMEVYHDKLTLYGMGDMINGYKGSTNLDEERYNTLVGGAYVVDVDVNTGDFAQLRVVPILMNRLRLERYTP